MVTTIGERRHSTIGYLSPIDYEQQFINTRTHTAVESWYLSTELGQSQGYHPHNRLT
jgi:hypothetical protein